MTPINNNQMSDLEEIRDSQVKILANMAYGYNGADPTKPKYSEDGIKYATQTLNDIISHERAEAVKNYLLFVVKCEENNIYIPDELDKDNKPSGYFKEYLKGSQEGK